jgi:hypothetical protein
MFSCAVAKRQFVLQQAQERDGTGNNEKNNVLKSGKLMMAIPCVFCE